MIYKWITVQRDGLQLEESRGDGLNEEERKNCSVFSWVNQETGKAISVDLNTGRFHIGDQVLHPSRGDVEKLSDREQPEYRLIYAKRFFFSFGAQESENVVGFYLIGWQITLEKRNIKRILYISPSGEIIFGGEG